MNKHEKLGVKKQLTKANVLTRSNVSSFKHQNPVTVSEKLNLIEKKFQTVNGEMEQLKIDHQLCKNQLVEAQQEISQCKEVTNELRSEICELKKKFVPEEANIAGSLMKTLEEADVAMRTIYQKFPCKSQPDLDVLKKDLMDTGTLIYMVSIK